MTMRQEGRRFRWRGIEGSMYDLQQLTGMNPPRDEVEEIYQRPDAPTDLYTSAVIEQTKARVRDALHEVLEVDGGTYFFQSDTGTGKSTGFVAALPSLLDRSRDVRVAIAVPTTDDAEAIYRLCLRYLHEAEVGVWTSAHKNGEYGEPMDRSEAGKRRVFVGTHQNILSNDVDPRPIIGNRDIVIVDETPANHVIEAFTLSKFAEGLEAAMQVDLSCLDKVQRLHKYAETRNSLAINVRNAKFSKVNKGKLPMFSEEERREVSAKVTSVDDRRLLEGLIAFTDAATLGHTFERVQRFGKDGRMCLQVYFEPMSRFFEKVVVFSATSHLDGFQHGPCSGNLQKFEGSKVDYRNLHVYGIPWPECIPQYSKRWSDKKLTPLLYEHLHWIVGQARGIEVLLVVPKAIVGPISVEMDRTYGGSMRTVHVTNWGRDIGSNEFRGCTDVILYGNHHKPKEVVFSEYLIFAETTVTDRTLFDIHDGTLRGRVLSQRESKLVSNLKQMGNRGNVRNIRDDGSCGHMNLFVCWHEFNPSYLEAVLPGMQYQVLGGVPDKFSKRAPHTFMGKLMDYLEGETRPLIEREDVCRGLGVSEKRVNDKAAEIRENRDLLAMHGWQYIDAKRGPSGHPFMLARIG